MEEFNILLIILQKCKAADIRFVYRYLNVSIFSTNQLSLPNVKDVKKTFVKK